MSHSLIAVGQPTGVSLSITGGDASFTVDSAALLDGDPGRNSKIEWDSASQTTSSYVAIRMAWGTATDLRVAALLNLVDAPDGVQVRVYGKRASDSGYDYDLGGNSQVGAIEGNPVHGPSAWFVFDAGLDPVVGVEFRIVNNANGSTWIAAEAEQEIGELFVSPATTVKVLSGTYDDDLIDTTELRRTLGGAVDEVEGVTYRRVDIQLIPQTRDAIRDGGLDGLDVDTLRHRLSRGARCALIPRWSVGGLLDATELHRTAMYGVCTRKRPISHRAAGYYDSGFTFEQIPA